MPERPASADRVHGFAYCWPTGCWTQYTRFSYVLPALSCFARCVASHALDDDRRQRWPIVEIDFGQRVVAVVVALAVDVVIPHEQHDGSARVGEYLAVRVVQRTAGVPLAGISPLSSMN